MKTAMQELIEIMMDEWGEGRGLPDWAEKAIENEKEQIINTFDKGYNDGFLNWPNMGEKFYDQIYNQNK